MAGNYYYSRQGRDLYIMKFFYFLLNIWFDQVFFTMFFFKIVYYLRKAKEEYPMRKINLFLNKRCSFLWAVNKLWRVSTQQIKLFKSTDETYVRTLNMF